jgi:AraC-like DNA-binding protein
LKTWSETSHTVFFHSRYPPDTIRQIIIHIAEGHGIRDTARILNLSKDAVNHIVRKAGAHCRSVMQELLTDLHLEQCQMDELCSFVKKNLVAAGTTKPSSDVLGSGSL